MKPSLLVGKETHREISALLAKGEDAVVSGLANDTAKAMLLTHLLGFYAPSTLVITENHGHLEALAQWLHFFGLNPIILPYSDEDEDVGIDTLRGVIRFCGGEKGVFLTTKECYEHQFPIVSHLRAKGLHLKKGDDVDFTRLVEDLLARGYTHNPDGPVRSGDHPGGHLEPGEYHRVGDTLSVFPLQSSAPVSLSFSFDVLEKIVLQGEEDKELPSIDILGFTSEREQALYEQIPSDALVVFDDQDQLKAPSTGTLLRFTSFPEGAKRHLHVRYLSVLKFYTLPDFLNDIKDKLMQGWRLVIVSRRADELRAIFREEAVPFVEGEEERKNAVTLICSQEGDVLPHSMQNPDLQCALLTDREIFSLKKGSKQRSVQKLALDFITSLSPGDYVVHMDHGIGQFEGMTQKTIDNTVREYLEMTYAEGDKLYVPVDQADKLSKYVHEEGQQPTLTRLGTPDWKKVTEKIKKETEEIAKELLELYAKRAKAKGFAYQEDGKNMQQFEESFPYALTPGQRSAVDDIMKDMEDDHPMDRLVCGDVGFGKTEVAMRAAFKAVQDGKQVAVVAPITILADQHFQNFQERMKEFSVRIDMLSRFRTQKQQTQTLEKLRKGEVDIIIGTHRLLQDDVKFFNLGLVIVDEEQRFGVKQKEKFKELRAEVDILTLTATPIPRTLNLGLHKLRDISTITTPPPGRLPIITEVRKYSDALVRDAILKEIKRDGQAFVLHNRVETIDGFADKLRALVPEATFVVAHGQLKPETLEERILSFKRGENQVLVSSTIIENGIDLPRANTLIVNEAERFGLAQLYQLRGRVGRGKVQAHAFLLYHTQKLKDDAKKRLRAIVEACELGSGFQVAMRDLEIRGAGEILGSSQAGTMQTVGVSHYLRLLKNAVEELKAGSKGRAEEEEINVEILLPVEAYLPSFYIPESTEKISVYQKLAASESEELLKEFHTDLKEEYGDVPRQVEHLFAVLRLKLACRKSGVIRIKSDERRNGRDIVVSLSPRVTAKEIMQLLQDTPSWKISSNQLRIDAEEIERKAGKGFWLDELTRQMKLLKKESAPKKKEAVEA